MSEHHQAEAAARRTLERMGYTHTGGELWRPPLGQPPNFNLLDTKDDEIARLRAALSEAIEFAEQDFQALTPAGEAMLARWQAALPSLKQD